MDKTTEILEGNKRIAQFMGYTYFPSTYRPINPIGAFEPGWKKNENAKSFSKMNFGAKEYLCRNHTGLLYHQNWEWMHEVLTKIKQAQKEYVEFLSFEQLKKETELEIFKLSILSSLPVVRKAVIQFLDWYEAAVEERFPKE